MTHVRETQQQALRYRWAVNVAQWTPSDAEFQWACDRLVLQSEIEHIVKFKFKEDRKRALISIALQRLAGVKYLQWSIQDAPAGEEKSIHPLEDISLSKTKGRKPYIVKTGGTAAGTMNNFNYNVSHDGQFVVLASELYCVCGCDVSSPSSVLYKNKNTRDESSGGSGEVVSMETLKNTLKAFEKQLTANEWGHVFLAESFPSSKHLGARDNSYLVASSFAKYWALKESYVKGIGMGLGYDLGRVEFEIVDSGREEDKLSVAFLSIDGSMSEDWCCYLHKLDEDHWVAVARGPVGHVVDALGGFKATFGAQDLDKDVLNAVVFQNPEPEFTHLRFVDVLRMGYGEGVLKEYVATFGSGG